LESLAARRKALRKDTAWVAIVCLFLGGLIGYLIGSQTTSKQLQQSESKVLNSPGVANQQNRPESHPPITTEAEFETLKQAVAASPNNSAIVVNLANKYYDAGRYEEAIRYYLQALEHDPNNLGIITDLGTAYFYSGHPDEALTQYNRSLQINPRHIQTLHNLVIVNLQGKNDLVAARAALEQLRSVDPRNGSIRELDAMINQSSSTGGGPATGTNRRQRIF